MKNNLEKKSEFITCLQAKRAGSRDQDESLEHKGQRVNVGLSMCL